MVALGLHIEKYKVPVPLATDIFFWRHAVDSASITAIVVSLLSQVSLTLTRVTSMFLRVVKSVTLCIASCRSVLTNIVVVNLSLTMRMPS